MKKANAFLLSMLALFCFSNYLKAQSPQLFKDLYPGDWSSHSQPDQFINVNGTMFFHVNRGPSFSYEQAIWKSDGTPANTVLVADSIAFGNATNVTLRTHMNGDLYYTVSTPLTTYLWKTNGVTTSIVDTFTHTYDKYPNNFTVLGNQMFFTNSVEELWVTDGTVSGTQKVNASLKTAGTPLVVYNGKVYFTAAISGIYELYSTDGTLAGTGVVKPGVIYPEYLIAYKNELYFAANGANELWKTDGTSSGTILITNTTFRKATIFKNELYYTYNQNLWKTDGTAAGTSLVMNGVGSISGMLDDYFFTAVNAISPFYKSDGTSAGTVQVSDSLGLHASFTVLNNKMYTGSKWNGSTTIKGLWETDGTEAGTKKYIPLNTAWAPFIFNNDLFFANNGNSTSIGIELWSFSIGGGVTPPAAPSNLTLTPQKTQVAGQIKLDWTDNSATEDGFVIERSNDGASYIKIDSVSAATYTDMGLLDGTTYYYRVAAYNSGGISGYSNSASAVTLTVGLSELNTHNSINIYPNPSNGIFTIQVDGNMYNAEARISTLLGESVYNERLSGQELNLKHLPEGIYLIQISSEGRSLLRKVVIQK